MRLRAYVYDGKSNAHTRRKSHEKERKKLDKDVEGREPVLTGHNTGIEG